MTSITQTRTRTAPRTAHWALVAAAPLAIATVVAFASGAAQASTVTLDFEGVNATYPSTNASIGEFYNGGTSSAGTSGTDYGVSFTDNSQALCLNTLDITCSDTSRGGQGDPASQLGALYSSDGNEIYMNVAGGFDTSLSFYYSATTLPGSVNIYDGAFGTGDVLATLDLGLTASSCSPDYEADFCPFETAGISFDGMAMSAGFASTGGQFVYDDVTFASVDAGPSPVPLPASLPLLVAGLGGLAVMRRRRA